jgi:hypothetical protein
MVEFNPHQFQYPTSMDDESVPSGIREDFRTAHEVYGTRDMGRMFPTEVGFTGAPWPKAGRQKHTPAFDQELVTRELSGPPNLQEFDPRNLHATQPRVLSEHVGYYMDQPTYSQTGRTARDQDNVGNQYPFVYQDRRGRNLLLAGHHRATAALLRGEPLRARTVRET